jgi:hypothetical protein
MVDSLKDSETCLDAAEALKKNGQPVVDMLIDRLKVQSSLSRDDLAESDSRAKIAESLGKFGDRRAVQPLLECLKGEDAYVFEQAAQALAELGDQRAVLPLIQCLKNESGEIRSHAMYALGSLGDARAAAPLIAGLKDADPMLRAAAASALGNLGSRQAVPKLVAALPDWPNNETIVTALRKLDWKPETKKEQFYCHIAQRQNEGLLQDWSQTKQFILEDARTKDSRKVENAVYVSIVLGKEDLLSELVTFLNSRDQTAMAEVYLNCGQATLSEAAQKWAKKFGYDIMPGGGGTGPRWGNWGTR